MICGQTCDGLYHFAFYLSTLAVKLSVSAIIYPRWTATLCLMDPDRASFPALKSGNFEVCIIYKKILGTFDVVPNSHKVEGFFAK